MHDYTHTDSYAAETKSVEGDVSRLGVTLDRKPEWDGSVSVDKVQLLACCDRRPDDSPLLRL